MEIKFFIQDPTSEAFFVAVNSIQPWPLTGLGGLGGKIRGDGERKEEQSWK